MTIDWLKLDSKHCWHPFTQHGLDPEPLPVIGAQGAWLELANGQRLLDGISSWWACLHGHGHPRLVKAITEQAAQLDHVLFAGCAHEPAARLSAELVEHAAPLASQASPSGSQEPLARVFWSDDGSTAVEVALKAAYQSHLRNGETSRTTFIALEDAYHGDTVGAMSASEPAPFFEELSPFLFHVVRVKPNPEELAEAFADLEGRVAAFIFEPLVQGAAGMKMYDSSFLKEAQGLCQENGAFMIADEVLTGFGRTGTTFACEQANISPDFLCLSKGLTGGTMPLAATLCTEAIFQSFVSDERTQAFFHGHTYTANPIGCAVALESLRILREENTPQKLAAIGARIEAGLADLRENPRVKDLRRRGGIVALELQAEKSGYMAELGSQLRTACRNLDSVLLRPLGNVLYAMPPACTTNEECDRVVTAMQQVVNPLLDS